MRISDWSSDVCSSDLRTLGLASADGYPMILAQIRQVAAAVGHTERGEALIRAMNRELAALPRPKRRGVAAYYQRRGYKTGTGTLVDDLLQRVGRVNNHAARRVGTEYGSTCRSQWAT